MRLIDAEALEKAISISHSMTDNYGIKTGYEISMRLVEEQPTVEVPDINVGNIDDCISRKAAIDCLNNVSFDCSMDQEVVEEELLKLPPAHPTISKTENVDGAISRRQAIDALRNYLVEKRCPDDGTLTCRLIENEVINKLPSIQPEQTKMIKEIREWINSGNRGSADYFIVDKIEEILNKYE